LTLAPRGAPGAPEWLCGGCAGAGRGAVGAPDAADAHAATLPPCCPLCGTRMRRAVAGADTRAFLAPSLV
jgi:hypothetical protein